MTAPAAIALCFNCFATFPAEEAVHALRPGHVFCQDCVIAKAWSVVGKSEGVTCSERTAALLLEAELTKRGPCPHAATGNCARCELNDGYETTGRSLEGVARQPGMTGVDFTRGEPLDSPPEDWRLTRAEED